MSYVNVYSSRINWENEPSITSPINATNLNKMDYALHEMDGTFANWDTTKANESDMLLAIKSVDYDTDTGVFLFTWFNGTTKTVDLNIEKIPVSFSMSPQGVITMKTEDGTEYTADVGSLIKTYTFNDSSEIDFTVTTDASGNKTVTASLVAGSIDGTKLTPNYLADCTAAKTAAEGAANSADDSAEDAEAWAVGQRNGTDVPSTDPTYHNNAKYWSEQSNPTTLTGLTDTDINNPTNGQGLIYNSTSQKWENGAGGGSVATLSDVNLTSVAEGDALIYDATNSEWDNVSLPGQYEGLYGFREITSSKANLNDADYKVPGTYFKTDTTFSLLNAPDMNTDVIALVTVKKISASYGDIISQEMVYRRSSIVGDPKASFRYLYHYNGTWTTTSWDSYPSQWYVDSTITAKAGIFSSIVSASAGDTSVTFGNVTYYDYWTYDVYCDDGTGEPIAISKIEVNSDNEVVVTFANALVNNAYVKLHYWQS